MPSWLLAQHVPASLLDPPALKFWLTHRGLLTAQLQAHFGKPYSLRMIGQRRGVPDASEAVALKCAAQEMLIREIELMIDGEAMIFARTWVPDTTLGANSWLGTLGSSALGEKLATAPSLERGELECASLRPGDALWDRSLRDAQKEPQSLWARRSWFSLGDQRLLVTEVFLPEFTECIRGF